LAKSPYFFSKHRKDNPGGYFKSAKSKSGGQALIGSLVWIGLLLAAGGA
jgi:hypothetical protein